MHFGLKSLGELPPLEEFEETFGGEPAESAGQVEARAVVEVDSGMVEDS